MLRCTRCGKKVRLAGLVWRCDTIIPNDPSGAGRACGNVPRPALPPAPVLAGR